MDDIQSWSEVPSIAHFCSLFRAAFNLLDFDIEELEEALLTDGTEDAGSSLLQELIVRLLCGSIQNSEISTFNYQMFLRRLFRQKCHEYGRENPFNTDIDFQFLPLRTKVEILHALCDFRLDADDVQDLLKNLESDSLRVEPLGHDENKSAYWYFYGTRLYREDFPKNRKKIKEKRRKSKEDKRKRKKSKTCYESDIEEDTLSGPGVWQVVCYTEDDWEKLAANLKGSACKEERSLYRTLTEDFLPEIPRLFTEKERLQKKRLMEYQPRRQSSRLEKLKQKEEQEKVLAKEEEDKLRLEKDERERRERLVARAVRAINRGSEGSECGSYRSERGERSDLEEEETMSKDSRLESHLVSVGRQTNNSLSSATGQIIIQPPRRKKLRSKQVFKTTAEDLRTGMYKILDHLKNHEEAWPFVNAVDENYAPRYYSVIRHPMDLDTMEEKLDAGEYVTLNDFRADFQLIVDNCRQYNGWENEYTEMVRNLQDAFQDATDRFLESDPSSDEEVAVEFQSANESEKEKTDEPCAKRRKTRRRERDSDRDKENKRVRQNEDSLESDDSNSKPPYLKPQRARSPLSERSGSIPGSDFDDREPDFLREHSPPQLVKAVDELDSAGDESSVDSKTNRNSRERIVPRRRTGVMKNPAAIEALSLATEQTLKDINKWLDDTPRFSEFSSASNSPCPPDDLLEEKPKKKEMQAKRRRHYDLQKQQLRRKEVQRTIDRLQPGKSKGNLIANMPKVKDPVEETGVSIGLGLGKLMKESRNALLVKTDETGPKLSLGTVLKTDIIGFGKTKHSFDEKDVEKKEPVAEINPKGDEKPPLVDVAQDNTVTTTVMDDAPDTKQEIEDVTRDKENEHSEKVKEEEKKCAEEEKSRVGVKEITNKSKPTPNLSAWFKAFGAPKAPSTAKRKPDLNEPPPTPGRGLSEAFKERNESKEHERSWLNDSKIDAPPSVEFDEPKSVSVASVASVASPMPSPDIRPDASLATASAMPRQRKASTSSSLSERSSFSQDPMDGCSPQLTMDERLGAPYPSPSPLHPSPSPYPSPKADDTAQKNSYPAINGTIRVGFYQDTSSNLHKSSPEKQSPNSNSPRDQGSSSPFQSYSHVYPPAMPAVSQPAPYGSVPGGQMPQVSQVSHCDAANVYSTFTSAPSTTSLFEYALPNMYESSYRAPPKTQDNYNFPTRPSYPVSVPVSVPEQPPKPPSSVFPVKKRLYAEIEAGRLQIPSRTVDPSRHVSHNQQQVDQNTNMNLYADPTDSLAFCRLQAQPVASELQPQYDRYGQQRMHAYQHDPMAVSDLSKQAVDMNQKAQQMPSDYSKLQPEMQDKARGLATIMDNIGRLQQSNRGPYTSSYTTVTEDDGVFRSKEQTAFGQASSRRYQGMESMDTGMLSHIVDRYQSPFYTDKGLANMYGKNVTSHTKNTGGMQDGYCGELNIPKPQTMMDPVKPPKGRKKQPVKSSVESSSGNTAFQQYVSSGLKPSEPSAISLKTASVVPGSAFNFGPAPSALGLNNPLYSDSGLFDELRQQPASYYSMVAAAAHHGAHRTTPDPAAHPPPRSSAYPYMNPHQAHQAASLVDTAAYQQYIQRFQEEQLRHSGVPVLHQGLYPPSYHPLGMSRQSFERPSWL